MKNKKGIYLLLTYLPMGITLILLPFFPDTVPAHYNALGEVDRYGSKYELLILPLMVIGFGYLMRGMAKLAEKQEQNEGQKNNGKIVLLTGLGGIVLFNALTFYFLYTSFHQTENLNEMPFEIYQLINLIFGILFVILGNIMPKVKRNGLFGVRLSYSMKNDVTWQKCQRFGGIAFMVCGVILIVTSLLGFRGIAASIFLIVLLLAYVLAVVIYSYQIAKKY